MFFDESFKFRLVEEDKELIKNLSDKFPDEFESPAHVIRCALRYFAKERLKGVVEFPNKCINCPSILNPKKSKVHIFLKGFVCHVCYMNATPDQIKSWGVPGGDHD